MSTNSSVTLWPIVETTLLLMLAQWRQAYPSNRKVAFAKYNLVNIV